MVELCFVPFQQTLIVFVKKLQEKGRVKGKGAREKKPKQHHTNQID